jgi:hypothetical protein
MTRTQASPAARGYGPQHRALRKRLLEQWQPGDPCARCGQPMLYRWQYVNGKQVSAIDLGHLDGDKSQYTGLEHAACNRAAGARQTNRLRRARGARRRWTTSRAW